jgi:AraC family transcriptional regulator
VVFAGIAERRAGSIVRTVDANTVLHIPPGREYIDRHPVKGVGNSAIVVTPDRQMLGDLHGLAPCGFPIAEFALVRVPPRVLMLAGTFLGSGNASLNQDENFVELLSALLFARQVRDRLSDSQVVMRAKTYLHDSFALPASLVDVAKAVGVSPVYLTQAFRDREGLPLYRYQTRLRMAAALARLAACDDISSLALDLGYSSHSHFTAAFRATFGISPSRYRCGGTTVKSRQAARCERSA